MIREPVRVVFYYSFIVLTVVTDSVSLVLFAIFLFSGPLFSFSSTFNRFTALLLDAGLSLLFFLQHSGMVRQSFWNRFSSLLPVCFHRAVYAFVSGMVLLVVVIFWQQAGGPLFSLQGVWRWVSRVMVLSTGLWFLWSIRTLRLLDTFGVQPLLAHLHGNTPCEPRFTAAGPYRLVRHPLYGGVLCLIWIYPDPTIDRLLFDVMWSIWIVTGAVLEERDLVGVFGDAYKRYQSRVPMFLPVGRGGKTAGR